MKWFSYAFMVTAFMATGYGSLNSPRQSFDPQLPYHNAQYDLTFFLPASWSGYLVLTQEWEGQNYSPVEDKTSVTGHGALIVLRHPQWKASAPRQDIPILVFTRSQWDDLHHGKTWPSLYAGGVIYELGHNRRFVFGISSRYNADDSVKGWKEAAEIVERNRVANDMANLYPE